MFTLLSRQCDILGVLVALDIEDRDSGDIVVEGRRDDVAPRPYFDDARTGNTIVVWAVLLEVERMKPGCCGALLTMVLLRGKGGFVDGFISPRCIIGVLYLSALTFGIKSSVPLLHEYSELSEGGG